MTVRRVKTYTAETGRVYEYYFVGQREALDPSRQAAEYIFDVIRHDHGRYAISVFLPRQACQTWEAAHQRQLGSTERYACAKLRLLKGFDEIEEMFASGRELWVEAEAIEDLLALLRLE